MNFRISRGRDIHIPGAPRQEVVDGPAVRQVGLLGADYPHIRFNIPVEPGQKVTAGEPVLIDRHRPSIVVAAPASGTVTAVNRGARRALSSLVIEVGDGGETTFDPLPADADRAAVRDRLLEAGLWPAFLRRPFGRIPDPDETPDAIFVAAMDSNPLAADAAVVLGPLMDPFRRGLATLAKLTNGPVHVCHGGRLDLGAVAGQVTASVFTGRHPAGLPGTHIHRLMPVGGGRKVWQIDYQDVVATGMLAATGKPWRERVVALAGPGMREPELVRTLPGADIDDLIEGRIREGAHRVISGSPLSGRVARFVGRYHHQVTALEEAENHTLAGFGDRPRNTSQHGFPGPFFPVPAFDSVLPYDIPAVPLLRALLVGDDETAERLGCLELLEEDVALLSYVCPAKNDYGALLRGTLDRLAGAA